MSNAKTLEAIEFEKSYRAAVIADMIATGELEECPGALKKDYQDKREDKEFLDNLSGRLKNLPYDSQFKSQLEDHLIEEIQKQVNKYESKKAQDYMIAERLAELKKQKEDSSRANGGHNSLDWVGHYTNAWIDSGEGGWWIDENGNEHSH